VQEPEEAADTSWADEPAPEKPVPKHEKPAPEKSWRPDLKLRHASKIEASVDATGADLTLGGEASLVFPVGSLASATPYHFAQRRGTPGPTPIGLNYELAPDVNSVGDAFVLELPLPKGVKTANFAMLQTPIVDGKPGKGWKVVAATRIDLDRGLAVLETDHLHEGWVYLTSKSAN
jgi:hypothetical protein